MVNNENLIYFIINNREVLITISSCLSLTLSFFLFFILKWIPKIRSNDRDKQEENRFYFFPDRFIESKISLVNKISEDVFTTTKSYENTATRVTKDYQNKILELGEEANKSRDTVSQSITLLTTFTALTLVLLIWGSSYVAHEKYQLNSVLKDDKEATDLVIKCVEEYKEPNGEKEKIARECEKNLLDLARDKHRQTFLSYCSDKYSDNVDEPKKDEKARECLSEFKNYIKKTSLPYHEYSNKRSYSSTIIGYLLWKVVVIFFIFFSIIFICFSLFSIKISDIYKSINNAWLTELYYSYLKLKN